MAKINCSVDSCTYWGKGDVCEADSIMVRNNQVQRYDMEIGAMGGMNPETSAETMCETFKPRKNQDQKE
ncbi:MAG: DUF1540 domain-containing protein [Patescibacteria group bacterium]